MPNWCEGNIRFRGTSKNIKRFFLNEIVCCSYEKEGTITEKPVFNDYGCELIITKPDAKPDKYYWFYINTTHRNFFEGDIIEVRQLDEDNPDKETVICVDGFKAAWSFEKGIKAWKDFARKYDFDVKLTGFECGMIFSQVKTITKDGSVKDTICEYEDWMDWMWNCPEPNKGG